MGALTAVILLGCFTSRVGTTYTPNYELPSANQGVWGGTSMRRTWRNAIVSSATTQWTRKRFTSWLSFAALSWRSTPTSPVSFKINDVQYPRLQILLSTASLESQSLSHGFGGAVLPHAVFVSVLRTSLPVYPYMSSSTGFTQVWLILHTPCKVSVTNTYTVTLRRPPSSFLLLCKCCTLGDQ